MTHLILTSYPLNFVYKFVIGKRYFRCFLISMLLYRRKYIFIFNKLLHKNRRFVTQRSHVPVTNRSHFP